MSLAWSEPPPMNEEASQLCAITPRLLAGLVPNGPTDPIAYYKRPLIGRFFRERINIGLRMIAGRRYATALEVGYGAGAVLLAIGSISDELYGIDLDADPAPVQALLAGRGLSASLIRGSVYELPYDSGMFDLVVSFSVFEHLHDYELALREVARVLRPGGSFLLGMPTVNSIMELGFRAIGFKGINDIHVTTPKAVARIFSRAEFRVANSARLHLVLGFPLYFNWLLVKNG
jgi:ubiquinone/menaquinone biosynthesis C-methylase UbiE